MKTLNSLGMPVPNEKPRLIFQTMPPIEFEECLYFIQPGTGGPVKIGYIKQLATRLKAIHKMNGGSVRFLGAMAGTCEDEKRFHEEYANDRLHGEWFRLSPEILLFLCGAGMKPTIAVQATTELLNVFSLHLTNAEHKNAPLLPNPRTTNSFDAIGIGLSLGADLVMCTKSGSILYSPTG
ncbi:MAG: GIY-YIG nuclease family protein [Nitrospira sp.]